MFYFQSNKKQSHSDDDFTQDSLSDRATRRTYLVKYSQIDKRKFPTNGIVNAFSEVEGKMYVEHWVYYLEPHKKQGEHFHLYVKLSGPK